MADANAFLCTTCGKLFSTKQNVDIHTKTQHSTSGSDKPKFACDVCDKIFNKKSRLKLH